MQIVSKGDNLPEMPKSNYCMVSALALDNQANVHLWDATWLGINGTPGCLVSMTSFYSCQSGVYGDTILWPLTPFAKYPFGSLQTKLFMKW